MLRGLGDNQKAILKIIYDLPHQGGSMLNVYGTLKDKLFQMSTCSFYDSYYKEVDDENVKLSLE